jgi:hypothetical protein
MSERKEIYRTLCVAEDLETEVGRLSDWALREVDGYLARFSGGIPALVRGVVELEASVRFMSAKAKGGEG